jgi:hypothetical protein
MSDPLRIALVAEGPTDYVVIEAALRSMLAPRPFVLTQIFPEGSASFGELGSGWVGVYRWCHQSRRRGDGRLSNDALVYQHHDLLIIHLDADVAGATYRKGSIDPLPRDKPLPCERRCPPPAGTTNALRDVLLSWCGEVSTPLRTVVCTPSKSTEAWVVAALFPEDTAIGYPIECYPDPESRLGQQPKKRRIRKSRRDYAGKATALVQAWPRLACTLDEAGRFQTEAMRAFARLPSEPPTTIEA